MEKQLLTSPEAETLTAIALVREDTWLGRSAWKDPGRPAASTLAPRQKLPYDCPLGIISGARGLAELLPHHHSFYIFIVSCQLFNNLVLQSWGWLEFFPSLFSTVCPLATNFSCAVLQELGKNLGDDLWGRKVKRSSRLHYPLYP